MGVAPRVSTGGRQRAGRPPGWLLRAGAWPVWLQRLGAGRLLGDRFLILTHRGRRTGRLHRTAVQVVRHDELTREWLVLAWGPGAEWLHNLARAPAPEVWVGGRRFVPDQRFLSEPEVADCLGSFRGGHPLLARIRAAFLRWPVNGSSAELAEYARHARGVAFGEPVAGIAPTTAGGGGGAVVGMLRRLGVAGPLEYLCQLPHGLLHPRLLTTGATPDEASMPLPGDDVVRDAAWVRTRSHTVRAPADAIWPWLNQLGAERAGWPAWYPFSRPHDPSPEDLLPGLAPLRPGDELLEVVGSAAHWRVVAVEPEKALVLRSCRTVGTGTEVRRADARRWADISWAFVLVPIDATRTRVMVRTRAAFSSPLFHWLVRSLGPGDNVMQREMLNAIGRRAERDFSRRRGAARAPHR